MGKFKQISTVDDNFIHPVGYRCAEVSSEWKDFIMCVNSKQQDLKGYTCWGVLAISLMYTSYLNTAGYQQVPLFPSYLMNTMYNPSGPLWDVLMASKVVEEPSTFLTTKHHYC